MRTAPTSDAAIAGGVPIARVAAPAGQGEPVPATGTTDANAGLRFSDQLRALAANDPTVAKSDDGRVIDRRIDRGVDGDVEIRTDAGSNSADSKVGDDHPAEGSTTPISHHAEAHVAAAPDLAVAIAKPEPIPGTAPTPIQIPVPVALPMPTAESVAVTMPPNFHVAPTLAARSSRTDGRSSAAVPSASPAVVPDPADNAFVANSMPTTTDSPTFATTVSFAKGTPIAPDTRRTDPIANSADRARPDDSASRSDVAPIATIPAATDSRPSFDALPTVVKLPPQAPTQWRQPLTDALGDKLQWQLGRQVNQATIQLDPPMLGRIEIDIRQQAGELRVQMTATNTEVLRQLHAIGDTLRHDLTRAQGGDVAVIVADASREARRDAVTEANKAAGDGQGQGQSRGRERDRDEQAQRHDRTPGRALTNVDIDPDANAVPSTSPFRLSRDRT